LCAGRLHHSIGVPGKIKEAFDRNPELSNLRSTPILVGDRAMPGSWRNVVSQAVQRAFRSGIHTALSFYDIAANDFRESAAGPCAITSGPHLRAHRCARGKFFHTNWNRRVARYRLELHCSDLQREIA